MCEDIYLTINFESQAVFDKVKHEKLACTRHVVRMIPLQRVFFPNEEEFLENIRGIVEAAFPLHLQTNVETTADFHDNDVSGAIDVDSVPTTCSPESAVISISIPPADVSVATKHTLGDVLPSSAAVVDEQEQGRLFAAAIVEKLQKSRAQQHQAMKVLPSSDGAVAFNISYKARNHNVVTKEFAYRTVIETMGNAGVFNCRNFSVSVLTIHTISQDKYYCCHSWTELVA